MIRPLAIAASLLIAGTAQGQAYRCAIPGDLPPIRAELPSVREPVRDIPIGSYTLALTWSPQYCRDDGDRASSRMQCDTGNRFGFTLHGLWPDGVGRDWPQYCRATGLLPQPVVRAQLCMTPSAQLVQHEWAKHGTCMAGYRPAQYFGQSARLYGRLRYPDMDGLSRRSLTVGQFAQAMALVNRGLRADQMRVTATRQGWLDEVWICLDRQFRYARCRPGSGGLPRSAALKIWRGAR